MHPVGCTSISGIVELDIVLGLIYSLKTKTFLKYLYGFNPVVKAHSEPFDQPLPDQKYAGLSVMAACDIPDEAIDF